MAAPVSLAAAARALGYGSGLGSYAVTCRRALERLGRAHGVVLLTRHGRQWEVNLEAALDLLRARPPEALREPASEPASVLGDALVEMLREYRARQDELAETVGELRDGLAYQDRRLTGLITRLVR